jgi:hypothetical protein
LVLALQYWGRGVVGISTKGVFVGLTELQAVSSVKVRMRRNIKLVARNP